VCARGVRVYAAVREDLPPALDGTDAVLEPPKPLSLSLSTFYYIYIYKQIKRGHYRRRSTARMRSSSSRTDACAPSATARASHTCEGRACPSGDSARRDRALSLSLALAHRSPLIARALPAQEARNLFIQAHLIGPYISIPPSLPYTS
jgi:hypothetical protein